MNVMHRQRAGRTLKRIVTAAALLFAAACSDPHTQIKAEIMPLSKLGTGSFPVSTYGGDRVQVHRSILTDGRVVPEKKGVYVSEAGQFVLKDGTPILSQKGEALYWNSQGYVVNKKAQVVAEYSVFVVNDQRMKNNTAMTLAWSANQDHAAADMLPSTSTSLPSAVR